MEEKKEIQIGKMKIKFDPKRLALLGGGFFVSLLIIIGGIFRYRAYNVPASQSNLSKLFEVEKNEGAKTISVNLAEAGLIKNKYHFYYYLWRQNLTQKIQAGTYELTPDMPIPEIADKFVNGEIKLAYEKLVIPEGFTNAKIVERINEIDPKLAKDFEAIIGCACAGQESCACRDLIQKYSFFESLPVGVDLEGYLFPDTYFVYPEDDAMKLVTKFLNNFEKKVSSDLINKAESQGKNLHEILTMASIVEKEVRSNEDKKRVAGIFWKRVDDDYLLQSCATLAYILGEDKKQYSIADTQIVSPFNTYQNIGLPPGPVSNPGIKSIEASISPEESDYYFFLSDPKTGETVFSKTLEEHNSNKYKHGL